MPLQKGFLRPKNVFDKKYLPKGIIIGAAFTFGLYGLMYMVREVFRVLGGMRGVKTLLILNPEETFYYNLFFGSLAAILGFYVTIKFVVENSIKHQCSKIKQRQINILNEEGFTRWMFLYAIAQAPITIGIAYMDFWVQFEMIFLTEFKALLILLPIVLFLNIWPPILRLVGRKAFKWMTFSFISIACTSFVFANINFLDYQRINKNLKREYFDFKYEINTPKTSSHSKLNRGSLVTDIFITKDSSNGNSSIYWGGHHNPIQLQDIDRMVYNEKDKIFFGERDMLIVTLHIDKSIGLPLLIKLKQELRKAGIRHIRYSTGVKNSRYPANYPPYKYLGLYTQLLLYHPRFDELLDSAESANLDFSKYTIGSPPFTTNRIYDIKNYNRVEISFNEEELFINQSKVSKEKLASFTYQFIKKYNPDYVLIFNPDESITYGRYIEILDVLYSNFDRIKNEMAYEIYGKTFNDLSYYEQMTFKEETEYYPLNIVEWTPEEKRLMELMQKN